jgi:hypothetical protein
MDRYERRVRQGAQWLDELAPDDEACLIEWRAKIDTGQLSLGSTRRCVLGQLYGNFYNAPGVKWEHTWANMSRGFTAPKHWWDWFPGYSDRYDTRVARLEVAWLEYLRSCAHSKVDA